MIEEQLQQFCGIFHGMLGFIKKVYNVNKRAYMHSGM